MRPRATRLGAPEVQDVYVLPGRRREGIASALTQAAEDLARSHGHDRISLGHSIDNEAARSLYERLGYRDSGVALERVQGTITIRGQPFEVDDTVRYLVKSLALDSASARSS